MPRVGPYQGAPAGGGSGGVEGKAELVNRIKALQRSGGAAKEAWINFCERQGMVLAGHTKHDPNAHSEDFIRAFMAHMPGLEGAGAAAQGPSSSADVKPGGDAAAQSANGSSSEAMKAALVQRVKGLQRSSTDSKQRWVTFCEMRGHRKHDPNVHDAAFLTLFLEELEQGKAPLEPPPGSSAAAAPPADGAAPLDSKEALVQRVKQVQRASADGKHRWIIFCETRGQKKHDPSAHDAVFLQAFFDSMQKGEIPVDATGKTELVQKIKEMQRKDPNGKQRWTDYCDKHGHGKHDPKIYDAEFLRGFFDKPELASMSGSLDPLQQAQQQQQQADAQQLHLHLQQQQLMGMPHMHHQGEQPGHMDPQQLHMTSYMQMVAAQQAAYQQAAAQHAAAAQQVAAQGGTAPATLDDSAGAAQMAMQQVAAAPAPGVACWPQPGLPSGWPPPPCGAAMPAPTAGHPGAGAAPPVGYPMAPPPAGYPGMPGMAWQYPAMYPQWPGVQPPPASGMAQAPMAALLPQEAAPPSPSEL